MKLNINGTDKELFFGMRFIRELDKKHTITQNGVSFGVGLQTVLPNLLIGSPTALSEIIQSAIKGAKQDEVDEAIERYAEEEDIETLFDEVLENLKTASLTKKITNELVDALEQTKDKE